MRDRPTVGRQVATPVEVIALAVSFASDIVGGELTLQPSAPAPAPRRATSVTSPRRAAPAAGLSVPSDNVTFVSIAGSDDGRAFLAGRCGAAAPAAKRRSRTRSDGSLYEFSYAADDGCVYVRDCFFF